MLRLIAEFALRGLAVTVVKRTHHSLADCQERDGSDSELYRLSSATRVGLIASDGTRWWPESNLDLETLDGIVLMEGGKRSALPKIEVLDPERGFGKHLVPGPDLIAVVGTSPEPNLRRLLPDQPAQWVDFLLGYWSAPKLSR